MEPLGRQSAVTQCRRFEPATVARLARGLVLFAAITAAGFWILSRRGTLGDLRALGNVQAWAIVVGCLQALLDQLLGGLRIWLCARALGRTSSWAA
jgi:hypothetical protein